MRILHVNHSDLSGGASIAAMRLHLALLKEGVDSKFLALNQSSTEPGVIKSATKVSKYLNLARFHFDQIPVKKYRNRLPGLFSPAWHGSSRIVELINSQNADIVHFHWINNGMIRVADIVKIEAPIVWSMHDMWPFTGGCHYDDNCGLYRGECGPCKVLGSARKSDLSHRGYKSKAKCYGKKNDITFIGLSKWLSDTAKQSSLLGGKSVLNLPNMIDPKEYKTLDREFCRQLFNLPEDKQLVLFGAMNATSDPRKGYSELVKALTLLRDEDLDLVVFGSSHDGVSHSAGKNIHFLGELGDTQSLVALYNAVDVMVVPSRQENLSNIIMESLACGTPVVGFDIGGNGDMIKHTQNGYLATSYSSEDLAAGISWVLQNGFEGKTNSISSAHVDKFSADNIIPMYISLYKEILTNA